MRMDQAQAWQPANWDDGEKPIQKFSKYRVKEKPEQNGKS